MSAALGRTAALTAGIGAAGVTWGLIEARWYTLREVTVPVLPAGQAPLRVLHLSDLHLTPGQQRTVDWVRDLDSLDPHLVVDTGDNWAHLAVMPALMRAFEPHLARPGAFVLGSNDYLGPRPKNPLRYLLPDSRGPEREHVELPWRELVTRFTSAGWVDLSNRRGTLTVDGRRLSLVGTDDAHLERDRFPAAVPIDGPTPDLHVGVTHAPYRRVLDSMLADGVDLAIAGHTHGGQVAVPLFGALTTNCDLDTRRAKGLHGWPGSRPDRAGGSGSMWLHVSAGLGTSPYAPVRFACRPEATLMTLVPRVA
ncbi:MAG: metallophosphoesterase [Actinobacteria bacterium]|nr:metallophosphoesterase [Actinomycetota bacterium]MCG2799382.1 metallophosphoesterase [Cellulomonas sp.]